LKFMVLGARDTKEAWTLFLRKPDSVFKTCQRLKKR